MDVMLAGTLLSYNGIQAFDFPYQKNGNYNS